MNMQEIVQKLEEITDLYIKELDRFSMEELTRKPDEEEWSLGQMYMHLINASLYMHLRNVRACAESAEGVLNGGEKSERGEAAYLNREFPNMRVRVPASPGYTPPQPASKEQLREGLRSVLTQMKETEPLVYSAPPQNKIVHPGFGALNAAEWFMLIEMHYRHHLRQKERLEQFLAGSSQQVR
ncbi:DinB family protein [Paenibacillus azoreducens]|uniref:DinB-like domain-containing protein n=1 Tax=Paenibacillus azoreducens TaxID=116718 RepID=A0A920CUA8_9BACL|nr:DinB family protein [Paenibacillus azoreducens]GIO51145.1 hypothetical protein J34TS1_59100 [Paenibacillus azoreducens]